MKILFLLIVGLLFSSVNSAQINKLKVKDVEVGTSYSTAIKKLGKPDSKRSSGTFPCDDGKMITAKYQGLVLKFIESYPEKSFFVASIEITSSRWSVSGIRIGTIQKSVKAKFSGKLRKENGFEVYSGFIKDGYSSFYFRNKRLVKIQSELNVC